MMVSGACSFSVAFQNGYKFTGKERDSETGLDYFGARYYGRRVAQVSRGFYTWVPHTSGACVGRGAPGGMSLAHFGAKGGGGHTGSI